MADNRLDNSVVSATAPNAKRKTLISIVKLKLIGAPTENRNRDIYSEAQYPSNRPSSPPPNESSSASHRNKLTRLAREAPSAVLTANSRRLAIALVSIRFVTFAQAISRTRR